MNVLENRPWRSVGTLKTSERALLDAVHVRRAIQRRGRGVPTESGSAGTWVRARRTRTSSSEDLGRWHRPRERLTSPNSQTAHSWSSGREDGLAYSSSTIRGGSDIWVLQRSDGDRKPRPLVRTPFTEGEPGDFARRPLDLRIQSSTNPAVSEIYVTAVSRRRPEVAGVHSTCGLRRRAWSRNRGELFFQTAPGGTSNEPFHVEIGATEFPTWVARGYCSTAALDEVGR